MVRDVIDTPARLQQRMDCNLSASGDFDRFVLDLLEPSAGDVVLDLGPGVGKQMVLLAATVGRIVGLDRSPEMAAAARARLRGSHATVVVGSMDHLGSLDLGGPFTLVYAVYSLYYAADAARVIAAGARLLEGRGARFVAVSPDLGNNAGWFADLGQLYEVPADMLEVSGICRRVILPGFRGTFPRVRSAILQSDVSFLTLESLMRYYDACPAYCRADKRDDAREYFRGKFERDGEYRIAKRSLGLVGTP